MKKVMGIVIGTAVITILVMIGVDLCRLHIPSINGRRSFVEVTVEETLFEGKFYFEQLSKEEQIVYKEIYQGLMEQQEEIYVHCADANGASAIFQRVIYDFAEIFWLDGEVVATTYYDAFYSEFYTVVELNYTYSSEERIQKEAEIERVATEIINSIPAESSEYDKIKYVYEYLINNVEYVEESLDNQNLYSSLVRKETVCAGYAKATQYLLNRMGIYCIYVVGKAARDTELESHAWNIVRCGGNYYYVDVTWADPINPEKNQTVANNLIYDYLCCSDEELLETHVLQKGYNYPVCSSTDLNYYRLNNMFYETIDERRLLNRLYLSIDAKEASITFKFADSTLYDQGRYLMLDTLMDKAAEYLGRKYSLNQVKYYYAEDVALQKFTVYWAYQ